MNSTVVSESYFANNTESFMDTYYVIPKRIEILIDKVLYFGIIPFLAIFGLILNSICCSMFCKLKKSCTVIMLITLALTDILILFAAVIQSVMFSSKFYGIPFSKNTRTKLAPYISPYVTVVPDRIGNVLTLLLSLERLFCVLKPLKIRQYSTRKNAFIAVILSYILPIVLCLPNLFYIKAETIYLNSTGEFVTVLRNTEFRKHELLTDVIYTVLEVLFRFIPVFGVMIASTHTWLVVIASARRRLTIAEVGGKLSKESQVTKTLLVITFVFVFCKLPVTILRMIIFIDPEQKSYRPKNNIYYIAASAFYVFLLLNSVVNFFIYFNTSSTYNAEFKALFRWKASVSKGTSAPEMYTVSTSAKFDENGEQPEVLNMF